MAGEVLGKTYEAMTRVALSLAGVADEEIFWDQRPKWLSIKADFILGKEIEKPEKIFLCTHSQSSKETEKKFWRNLEEFFESKGSMEKPLPAYNLIFNNNYKQKLLKIMINVFDGHLEIPEQKYGKVLLDTGSRLAKEPFKTIGAEAMVVRLQEMCDSAGKKYDKDLHQALVLYSQDLKSLLKKTSIEFKSLWPLIRKQYRKKITVRKAQSTYVKRGIGKLTIFTAQERKNIYEHVLSHKDLDELPDFVHHLGFFEENIFGGYDLADREISSVIQYLGSDAIESVIRQSPLERMNTLFIHPIRHSTNINLFHQFVLDHYQELITPEGMLKYMTACYKDPEKLLPKSEVTGNIERLWLYDYLVDLFKAKSGKKQGYGYSMFSNALPEADELVGNMRLGDHVTCFMNMFITRKKGVKFSKKETLYVAKVLANSLLQIEKKSIPQFVKSIIASNIQTNIETKLLPYRSFEPLGYLIQKTLDDSTIGWTLIKAHPSFLGEYAGLNAATTKVLLTKQKTPVLIKWQSAYDKGKGHKRKELAARCTSLKFQWQKEKRKFASRPYGAFILVLDGTWDEKDLEVLLKAGWDYIFYSHEMDDLGDLVKRLGKNEDCNPPIRNSDRSARSKQINEN